MPHRPNLVTTRNPSSERALRRAQATVAAGQKAVHVRNRLLVELYDQGYLQSELTAILNEMAIRGGGRQVTEHAVQKAIRETREGVPPKG